MIRLKIAWNVPQLTPNVSGAGIPRSRAGSKHLLEPPVLSSDPVAAPDVTRPMNAFLDVHRPIHMVGNAFRRPLARYNYSTYITVITRKRKLGNSSHSRECF